MEPQQKLDAGSDEEEESGDHPANAARFVGSGILDGLSIGSDHSVSLLRPCCPYHRLPSGGVR